MYLIQTVQTSWRPQLPLPKEVVPPTTSADPSTRSSEMNRHSNAANCSSNRKDTHQSAPQISAGGNKKGFFGRLFRKKKEVETESSSEEDRKAGFVVSPKYRKKDKKKHGSKLNGGGFDHIVVSPTRDNEFFLPFEPVPAVETHSATHLAAPVTYEPHSRSTNSLDRRSKRDRKKLEAQDAQLRHSSSEEEMISLNSSTTFTKYRSDESLGSGGPGMNGNGQSRRSRAARNERYYKRLSRDGEVSHGQIPITYAPQPAQRWKTQPVPLTTYSGQISQNPAPPINPTNQRTRPQYLSVAPPDQRTRNSINLSHGNPYAQNSYGVQQPPRNLQNTVNDGKRSISYDSHIHLQNAKKPLPPPPPPRDPLRRVNVTGHSDHRPISYAFDQSSSQHPKPTGMSGRCVSDDRIWGGNAPLYNSASSINYPPPNTAGSQNRRFITRAERDAHPTKKSLPSGLDFRYVAEATPRSRKPIHLLNQEEPKSVQPPSPGIIRTTMSGLPGPAPSNQSNTHISTEFACRGRDHNPRPESIFNKPRSVSSSRAGELQSYNFAMYSQVSKPKSKPIPTEDLDNVVSGSLLIKPSKDNQNNFVEIRNNANKSNSMPNHYQRRDIGVARGGAVKADSPTPNKYEEYVAEKRVRNILEQPGKMAPNPPQRKVTTKQLTLPPESDVIIRKKPTNLEDAINELEAIYKSLKLGDESLLDRAERRDIPTPTNFEKYAEVHTGEFLDDDDDESGKEPDIIRDDFAYRNIKHANLGAKASEKQPPFGIPIGPIAPSPRTDYLHVTPDKDSHKVRTAPFKYPDIVGDDLAVRTLRKDPPGQVKPQFLYPAGCLKKKRATRTQSANIYSLIQRNAAKPSGGDLHDYLELAKTLERAGSMSDIRKETDDIPSTLQLLRNLREQEQGSPKSIPFRHPSRGGAICNLPVVLTENGDQETAKIPIPLPRKSLSPDPEKTKMEEALNKIAKEAKESSEKLTKELMELRKEALITSSRPKVNKPSIERDLEQIEAVSEAAKRCRHILMDTIPPDIEDQHPNRTPPRRLATEDKLIKAIDQVSDAANKVCEKILNEIVTVEPPVIVQHAVEVKNRPKQELVMPSLIQKLDPSSARIGEIAERCMRQISELNDIPDYDNLHPVKATACNTTKHEPEREKRSDADILIVPGSSHHQHHHQQHTYSAIENEEEIDKIMKECEEQARNEANAVSKPSAKVDDPLSQADGSRDVFVSASDKTTTTTTSASSSSDCLKSSSPSAGQRFSSSITSFNPYSSSDYIKSPSSDFHAPSTDPIKTFSTTSYDVKSSSVTPNITNSPFSYTPSPPLNLTPVCSSGGEKEKGSERSSSASQYNSSEELAMIFGIEKSSPATTTTGKGKSAKESVASKPLSVDFENNLSSSTTANSSCQQQQSQQNRKLYTGARSQNRNQNQSQYQNPSSAYSSTTSSSQKSNRSHITTAPAYYTDEYLRIQTPPGSPLAATTESETSSINENYRSVYATPSKLITGDNSQKFFPKSPTATVPPPPIAAKRTILHKTQPQPQKGDSQKGDSPSPQSSSISTTETDNNASSVIAASFQPVDIGDTSENHPTESTSSKSSNASRFSNRKRVVRVRSDSRPISALYDIICKEKGIELDQEPTMSSSNDVATTGCGVIGIDSPPMTDTEAQPQQQQHHLYQHQPQQKQRVESGVVKMRHSTSSQSENSSENLNVNRYQGRSRSYQDSNDNGEREPYSRLQMKPDILTTSSCLASELNHYQQFDHNHPDHSDHPDHDRDRDHDYQRHHPHPHLHSNYPHCNKPILPSSYVVDSSLNNYCDSSSYVNRNNETSDIHEVAGAGGNHQLHHHCMAKAKATPTAASTTNGHAQQLTLAAAPRPAPRAFRDEKRRFTDGMMSNYVRGVKTSAGAGSGTGTGSDGDNGRAGSHPDSLIGVGKRYITRSSRTPGSGGSNNSESSPSPIPSASTNSSQHRLTPSSPASNSISSNRLRSPLKSPSYNRSTVHQQSSPAAVGTAVVVVGPASGSATINGNNGNNDHHQHYPQQQLQVVDTSRSVMTNSVGAVATAAAPSTVAAPASPLSEICGQSISPTNNHKELCGTNGRLVTKSSSASSIVPSKINQHNQNQQSQHRSQQQSGPNQHHSQQQAPVKIVRTTKASRLRAAALDKKKDSDELHPSGIPTAIGSRQISPRHTVRKPSSSLSNNSPDIIRVSGDYERTRVGGSSSPLGSKKLVPSMSVSMRQNLSELQYNGNNPASRRDQRPHTTECTVKVTPNKVLSHEDEQFFNGNNDNGKSSPRPRSSTMTSEINRLVSPIHGGQDVELSPLRKSRTPEAQRIEDRDKSSKRKSNLNRSLNEESTGDDEAALRRRRRRELGMARQLIPTDETSTAVRELFLSPKKSSASASPTSPRNDLAFHMENARRGIGLISPTASDRRRAQTASPKIGGTSTPPTKVPETKIPRRPADGKAISLSLGGRTSSEYSRRNRFRLSDVSQKVDAMRERTKSELAEIMKITEMCSADNKEPHKIEPPQKPPIKAPPTSAVDNFANSLDRIAAKEGLIGQEQKELNLLGSSASPRSFIKKDRISFDDGEDFHSDGASSLGFLRRRMLKARSVEREISLDQPKLSPILRRKSSDEPTNHIVSILKKKDQAESSSASSNASPVTFSSNTVDTPTHTKRQGILKKRSSLDESRYYSRSHSPDERSILVKSARRNSLEEIQHGILKQSSYESKSDGCPSAEPHHGILKKKDSTSTPSDSSHPSKHVSISQAVILAAAELCKDIGTSSSSPPNSNDSEYDNIRPILKVDSQEVRAPKPILKKKSSSETEEIRPILKTSRKSSREESSDQSDDQGVRPILRTDSPAKRRSFAETSDFTGSGALQRSRSLEHSSEAGVEEKPILSVAERVRNMERFLNSTTIQGSGSRDENSVASANTSAGAVPKIQRPSAVKRNMYKDRFRTQPITNDEIQCLQAATSGSLASFKPAFSLDSLSYQVAGVGSAVGIGIGLAAGSGAVTSTSSVAKISPRSLSSISPSPREVSDLFSPRSVTDLNCISISSDSGLQTGKNFEMSSGLDDSSLKADESLSIGEGGVGSSQRLPHDDSLTLCGDESNMETSGFIGLGRSSSVKARASMFQQLEEKTKSNRMVDEKMAASPLTRKAPRRLSTSPPMPTEDPKTPSNPPEAADEEFEPSSLPVAERLRFFSNLSDVSRNSGSTSLPITRLHYTVERRGSSSSVILNQSISAQTTPRSSIVAMDFDDTPTTPTVDEVLLPAKEDNSEHLTPTSTMTIKRLKLKTIGKLVMPSFLNERNNNNNNSENSIDNISIISDPIKKIGKIKSPFIENSQKNFCSMDSRNSSNKCMKFELKSSALSNQIKDDDICDTNADSGKENYDHSLQGVELRKKKVSTSSSSGISSAPASQRNSYQRSPLIDEKYAKYFGLSTNHTNDNRNSTPAIMQKTFDFSNMPDVCRVTPKPHLRQQNFTRSVDVGDFDQKSNSLKDVHIVPPSPLTPSDVSLFSPADDSEVFDDSDFGVVNSTLVQQMKRRDFASKRTRAMTVFANTPQSTPERKMPTLRTLRNRSMTITHMRPLPCELQKPITKYEELKVTKEDLLKAPREFERIFLEATKPAPTLLSPPFTGVGGPGRGILKSKSGCVGFMPMDLNSELKNRLKRSTHATVSNLRKSATSDNAPRTIEQGPPKKTEDPANSSSSEDDGVDPQKNLAKILRSVSKENMHRQQKEHITPFSIPGIRPSSMPHPQHEDTVSLVRNLSSLEKRIPEVGNATNSCAPASTSEGESSGGREISEIIKNSAVARRRKLNDGVFPKKKHLHFWQDPYNGR